MGAWCWWLGWLGCMAAGAACCRSGGGCVPSYAWLQEALAINSSLSCLGDVVSALAAKAKHVPYRWHTRGSGVSLLLLLLLLLLLSCLVLFRFVLDCVRVC